MLAPRACAASREEPRLSTGFSVTTSQVTSAVTISLDRTLPDMASGQFPVCAVMSRRFSVITSALFAFYVSLDEVIVAIFISTGTGGTLSRKMVSALRDQVDPTIAAISTYMVTLSILFLVLGQVLKP
ncbi:hypothetical protein [Agrobacterium tumefaciens]|nr:hypothetical protein [Agrobacterium tumefaciens]